MHAISHRVAGFLEREGILERDEENSYLNLDDADFDGAVGINQIAKGKFACLRGMFDPQIGYFFTACSNGSLLCALSCIMLRTALYPPWHKGLVGPGGFEPPTSTMSI